MNSSPTSELVDDSANSLIDWNSPETDNNYQTTNVRDWLNNPFDIMEYKAANMDPFDLVLNQTPFKNNPPCSNLLSPLRESKNRQIRKSVSLPNLVNVAGSFVENYKELNSGIVMEDLSKVVDLISNSNIVELSNEYSLLENSSGSKGTNNIESVIELDLNEVNIEQISLCNEIEKKQIREETRLKIEKLIEQEKHVCREICSSRSLSSSTPQRNPNESSDSKKSLLNKGFIANDDFCSDIEDNHSTSNVLDCVNDNNISSESSVICAPELNSFDLNSLKPEWVVDDFFDNDLSSLNIHSKDPSVQVVAYDLNDTKPVDLNCVGTVESKTNGSNKSMFTKKIPMKGPLLANIPLQHMVQNYKDMDSKPINYQSLNKLVITSPSTFTTAIKTPYTKPRSLHTSPKTPINKSSVNVLNDLHENTLFQTNVLRPRNSTSGSMNSFNVATEKKIGIQNSFQVNKSKETKSKIGMVSTPVVSNMKKVTGLPVPKRSMLFKFKGKENVKSKKN